MRGVEIDRLIDARGECEACGQTQRLSQKDENKQNKQAKKWIQQRNGSSKEMDPASNAKWELL